MSCRQIIANISNANNNNSPKTVDELVASALIAFYGNQINQINKMIILREFLLKIITQDLNKINYIQQILQILENYLQQLHQNNNNISNILQTHLKITEYQQALNELESRFGICFDLCVKAVLCLQNLSMLQ